MSPFQTQTPTTTTATETSSVAESSCDASSENSEESGAEEFSTATDDAEETLFNSAIKLDTSALSITSGMNLLNTADNFKPGTNFNSRTPFDSPSATVDSTHIFNSSSRLSPIDSTTQADVPSYVASESSSVLDHARLRKQTGTKGSHKRDRPWSVVGLQADVDKLDFQPLSTSESAIVDRLHKTDTDSSSSPVRNGTFPRKSKLKGVYQRAVSLNSDSAVSGSSTRTLTGSKRRLKYSSSSSATDSQTSRSSATKVAASTEDEGEKIFVYDSVAQTRERLRETETETTGECFSFSFM